MITVDEMRKKEKESEKTNLELMETAGRKVAQQIETKFGKRNKNKILIFCGPGNNGGDGLVCGRYLEQKGNNIDIVALNPKTKEAQKNYKKMESHIRKFEEIKDQNYDIIIDALLGLGFKPPLRGKIKKYCKWINNHKQNAKTISIDVATGKNLSGEDDPNKIKPDLTICIQDIKKGQIKSKNEEERKEKGKNKNIDFEVIDIGI